MADARGLRAWGWVGLNGAGARLDASSDSEEKLRYSARKKSSGSKGKGRFWKRLLMERGGGIIVRTAGGGG